MKTPRELLFEHHKNAEPDLDQIRRDLVRNIGSGKAQARTGFWGLAWLVGPGSRSGWRMQVAGLAAAWVMILALNLLNSDGTSIAPSSTGANSNRTLTMAWREYRRQLSEALETQPAVAAARPDQRSLLQLINSESGRNV
jgi:hypothetical protein